MNPLLPLAGKIKSFLDDLECMMRKASANADINAMEFMQSFYHFSIFPKKVILKLLPVQAYA
ncbi:MAG: hypothetical protein DSO07_00880 [Thermoproteota archaeon]|nr:MAG: hypothetical protein DSO07_00880 [Candidatus Korarchaeota archaeon]